MHDSLRKRSGVHESRCGEFSYGVSELDARD